MKVVGRLGPGRTRVFRDRGAEDWEGGSSFAEKQPSLVLKVAGRSKCQFHVYFPLLTSVCLGSLSLHIIKETAVLCEIKVGAQMCGHLASPLPPRRGDLVTGRRLCFLERPEVGKKPVASERVPRVMGRGWAEGTRILLSPGTLDQQDLQDVT